MESTETVCPLSLDGKSQATLREIAKISFTTKDLKDASVVVLIVSLFNSLMRLQQKPDGFWQTMVDRLL